MTHPQPETTTLKTTSKTKYRFAVRFLAVAVTVLFVIVLILPGALRLLYRADAQVALGNAKVVRQALQAVGTECYGSDTAFHDSASLGGVTEEVYREVLMRSKVPGDFWVLQLGRDGCSVERFLYQEGDYTVYYQKDPLSYEVYREENYITTRRNSEE